MTQIRLAADVDYRYLPEIEMSAAIVFADYNMEEVALMPPIPVSYYLSLNPVKSFTLVCEIDQKLVGFCLVTEVDQQAHLKEVSVMNSYARKGIGTNLVLAALKKAEERGYVYMTLTTFMDIPFNAPFYKKLGFDFVETNKTGPELTKIRENEMSSIEFRDRVAMVTTLSTYSNKKIDGMT